MFVGPVFTREVATAPRRLRLYISRAAYVSILWMLMCTAWMVVTGTQLVRNVGDLARFGATLFQILAPLQLAIMVFFAALTTASAVSQEKDRRTLDLLLMTRLSNSELVLGKLMASLLNVLVVLLAALPLFMAITLFGGVSTGQVLRVFAVTVGAALMAGSLGSLIALWREKTFQALALTVLVLVFWIGGWEAARLLGRDTTWLGTPVDGWAASFSPWPAILEASRPGFSRAAAPLGLASPVYGFLLTSLVGVVAMNALAIARVRVWNPSREARPMAETEESTSIFSREALAASDAHLPTPDATVAAAFTQGHEEPQPKRKAGSHRDVWDNPILWREVCTWAYGRKIMLIKAAYLLLFVLSAIGLFLLHRQGDLDRFGASLATLPLFLLSLVLINAQAVTSITTERDGRALDLLLVTDLSPGEIIFGKLGGIFYNCKEYVLLPLVLAGYLWWVELISTETLLYLWMGLLVMNAFVAMLGVHTGMAYANSRSAIGVSQGTVFFLFIGVAACMRIMVAFSGSFQVQLAPFLAFMLGGGVGLYVALGIRNPSPAITLAALVCPFATFYAITSFLLEYTLGVFLVVATTYGFATAAMLVPAIYEFDVATGRSTGPEEV